MKINRLNTVAVNKHLGENKFPLSAFAEHNPIASREEEIKRLNQPILGHIIW